jgi:hypothetical protein
VRAKKRAEIDSQNLSPFVGVPMVPAMATKEKGMKLFREMIEVWETERGKRIGEHVGRYFAVQKFECGSRRGEIIKDLTLEVKERETLIILGPNEAGKTLGAIPACAARNVSVNLVEYSYGGFLFGSLSCIIGMVAFKRTGLPIGPLIVIATTFFFLISLFIKKWGPCKCGAGEMGEGAPGNKEERMKRKRGSSWRKKMN